MSTSQRIEFIPARDHDPWVPHQRISRVKLHPRIECVEEGTLVEVTLALRSPRAPSAVAAMGPHTVGQTESSDRYERIQGRRYGNRVEFLRASTLYPGLLCTPWCQFAIQEVRPATPRPEAARE